MEWRRWWWQSSWSHTTNKTATPTPSSSLYLRLYTSTHLPHDWLTDWSPVLYYYHFFMIMMGDDHEDDDIMHSSEGKSNPFIHSSFSTSTHKSINNPELIYFLEKLLPPIQTQAWMWWWWLVFLKIQPTEPGYGMNGPITQKAFWLLIFKKGNCDSWVPSRTERKL